MIREPAVAGTFYPGRPEELRRTLEELTAGDPPRWNARGLLVPHAGYVYSGGVAGRTFRAVRLSRRFVILCPNHTGRGTALAIQASGHWRTPLGAIEIDSGLAADLMDRLPDLRDDPRAHAGEHALEVELPFLQHLAAPFRFVPICVGTQDPDRLLRLGDAIAEAAGEAPEPVQVVISSDMSHYIPAERARERDMRAVAEIERMDPLGLHRVVHGEGITMCGVAPAVAGIQAARGMGAGGARLISYANSGDVSGDHDQVVGYAGVVLGPEPA
jgi:AmmeMemoRadiSam system protein B